MSTQIADLIDGLEFFRDFTYPELKNLARFFNYFEVDRGEAVFREGDPGNHMLILIDGKLSIYKGGESGSYLLSHEGKGRIVGEMALLDRELRSATCQAETPCQLLSLSQDSLDKLAEEFPALAYRFMATLARLLSKRLRRTSGILAEHAVG